MNQDWKQFTKAVTHELRDENLSPKECAQLVSVAAMLSVTQENVLPNEALLRRIIKEASVTNTIIDRSLYRDEKKYRFSFFSFPVLLQSLFSQKKWLLASSAMLMLLIITLSFSEAEKTFIAEQTWFPTLETLYSNEDVPSLALSESPSEKMIGESINNEEGVATKTSSQENESASEENFDTLLALTIESEVSPLTFDEDTAFQSMDQDINSLSQLYDENGF